MKSQDSNCQPSPAVSRSSVLFGEWKRIPGPSGGTCGAEWRHSTGAVVRHCGHPTALYPYYGFRANGERVVIREGDDTFSCFAKLAEIKAEALLPNAPAHRRRTEDSEQ